MDAAIAAGQRSQGDGNSMFSVCRHEHDAHATIPDISYSPNPNYVRNKFGHVSKISSIRHPAKNTIRIKFTHVRLQFDWAVYQFD